MPCPSLAASVSEPSFAIPRPELVGASGRQPSLNFLSFAAWRRRWIAAVLRTLTVIFAAVAIGRGALALPVVEVTEVMMQSQGTDAEFIARLYGPDPGVSLLFASNVDPAASRYDYALASGSTYRGQALALAGSGAVNPVSDQWETFSAFSLGADSWVVKGSAPRITEADPPFSYDLFDINDVLRKDSHSNVTYEQTAIRTVSVATTTFTERDLLGNETVVGTATEFDTLILQGPDAGKWVWGMDAANFRVRSDGLVPLPQGGAGVFTTRIVPEPPTMLLLGAVAGLLFLGKRVWSQRLRCAR